MTETAQVQSSLESQQALHAFQEGTHGLRPAAHVAGAASRLLQTALEHTASPVVTVTESGGLLFNLRLSDERLLFLDMQMNGHINASLLAQDHQVERRIEGAAEGQIMEVMLGNSPQS